LLFIATIYPLIGFVRQEPAFSMMMSLYVTLGIFLVFAARNPSAHRSLIAFARVVELCSCRVDGVSGVQ
jgi:hypothetical protein